jgi:uridylate kinase
MPKYERILLKLSGEAMAGPQSFGIDPDRVKDLAAEIAAIAQQGVEVGVVVGGGNIFRGIALAAKNMDRVTGDHMGMLATVINSLALQDALEQIGAAYARDERHPDASGGRAVHPPAGHSPSGKRAAS